MSRPSRLFLITPLVAEAASFAPLLEAAVGAADIACVLLRIPGREAGAKAVVRALAPLAQRHGAAVLVETDPRLAVRAEVDGVHLAGVGPELDEALATLQPDRIVGVGALGDRDEAMRAGEAGVDYVMFGGPDAPQAHDDIADQARWWAEIFNVPCVAYAHHPTLAGALARTGAEFVALCEGLWDAPEGIAATIRAADFEMNPIEEDAR